METGENKKMDNPKEKFSFNRRSLLKAFAGLPFVAALGFSASKKWNYDTGSRKRLITDLGLDDIRVPQISKFTSSDKSELLRIGMIGFGGRGPGLASALGYKHPSETNRLKNNMNHFWHEQQDLNVAVTGMCDVFDLHAEKGLETIRNEFRPAGQKQELPVKRYMHYHEMLNDKDIDAVIIATPDHHHAQITMDAVNAGKHVYCEKSGFRTLEEAVKVHDTVKKSKQVYQMGHQIPQNTLYHQAREIINRGFLGNISLIETFTNRNHAHGAWIRHVDASGKPMPGDAKSIDWKQWLGNAPQVPFSLERFYSWTKWWDYNNGLFAQLFSHEYDAVNQLLDIGIPASANSSGGIYYWKDGRETPDVLNCIFEYPDRGFSLTYTATLFNSRSRDRVIMGQDATMELGSTIKVFPDGRSPRLREKIASGDISPNRPLLTIHPGAEGIDALSTATERYYAARGLMQTVVNGKIVDVVHLHLKEWIDCIRHGGTTSSNIDRFMDEAVTLQMGVTSYREKRRVEWDPVNKRIV